VPRDRPDHPVRPDRPSPGSYVDLSQRLDRLPPSHPSSPRYRGGEIKPVRLRDFELPAAARDEADHRPVAARRPEWQEPLARGEVDRIGLGVIDERARRFLPGERRIAGWLAERGAAVVALPEDSSVRERKPDARVDDRVTEFKSLQPGATDSTVNNRLLNARRQAPHVVIDARNSGLDEASAQRGIARFTRSPWGREGFDSILIVGEDFLITKEREGTADELG
jgi:contact-dependent growth inhibition (CDI) system CdiA-like toxin